MKLLIYRSHYNKSSNFSFKYFGLPLLRKYLIWNDLLDHVFLYIFLNICSYLQKMRKSRLFKTKTLQSIENYNN
jgi:hypothetical protein